MLAHVINSDNISIHVYRLDLSKYRITSNTKA